MRLVREEEAVSVHCGNRPLTIGAGQRLRERTAAARHIVRDEGLVDSQVAVRVEAFHQLATVVIQVALNGVTSARLAQRAALDTFAAVLLTTKAMFQLSGATVGGVGDAAGQGEACHRCGTGIIVATGKVRVRTNRQILRVRPGNLLGGGRRTGGNNRASAHQLGVGCGPLYGACTTEGTADDVAEARDAQGLSQACLGTDRVTDGDERESGTPMLASARVSFGNDAGRTGRTVATAQNIGGNHEVSVGVDDRSGAYDALPPAVGFDSADEGRRHIRGGHPAGDMRVAGERMQNQDGVIASLIESTPGFVADGDLRQSNTGFKLKVADGQLTQVTLRLRVFGAVAGHGNRRGHGLNGTGFGDGLSGHGSLRWVVQSCPRRGGKNASARLGAAGQKRQR